METGSQSSKQKATAPLIGLNTGLREQMQVVSAVACRETTVLITGETGTGKELLAREIHRRSSRHAGPFIPVDCTNLTPSLFESQLFGHVQGAFTGAIRENLGLIRSADGGTLFLDEIGELAPDMQARFLRVLQDHTVWPLGAVRATPVDVRVIVATNRDLESMVQRGEFREDLYYRLAIVCIEAPPLRTRPQDIIPLAQHFLDAQALFYGEAKKTLCPDARKALKAYPWPGNVRQLANVIERAYVLSTGTTIPADALPPSFRESVAHSPLNGSRTLAEAEREAILAAIERAHSVKRQAAAILGIDVRRLNRLLARLDIRAGSQVVRQPPAQIGAHISEQAQ